MKKSGGIIFLKRGAAAKQAVQVEDAKAEARRAEYGRLRRFYIGYNEDSQITFLDGKLDEDGVLDCPRFMEHKIRIGPTGRTSPARPRSTPACLARSARPATRRAWSAS